MSTVLIKKDGSIEALSASADELKKNLESSEVTLRSDNYPYEVLSALPSALPESSGLILMNGNDVILCLSAEPDTSEEGAFICHDISHKKAALLLAARSIPYSALSLLTGEIAHDFNNYLGAAEGAVAMLARKQGDDEKMARRLKLIGQGIERSVSLSKRLGGLTPREARNMIKLPISEITSSLTELWNAQGVTHWSNTLTEVLNKEGEIKVKGSLQITLGLLGSLPSLLTNAIGAHTFSMSVKEVSDDEIKTYEGSERAGTYLSLSLEMNGDEANEAQKIWESLTNFYEKSLTIPVLPPVTEMALHQLVHAHEGALKGEFAGTEVPFRSLNLLVPIYR